MSAKILMGPATDPQDVWPGHAHVDRAGVELAVEMLDELANYEDEPDDETICTTDYCCLKDWARQGRPFRNVVAEYLQRARAAGGDVEAGFCAVLSDFVSTVILGSVPDTDYYADMFGIGEVQS